MHRQRGVAAGRSRRGNRPRVQCGTTRPRKPRNANLYALFERHFPDGALQPLLVIPNGPVIHYDDIAAASARYANALVAAGCMPGDRVAAQLDKDWRVLALYLACLRAGLVYLPLNTGYQKAELAYFFGDAEPRVIVCNAAHLGAVAAIAGTATVLTLDELDDRAQTQPATFATVYSQPDDLAAILYTSGTTGRSKGAVLTHRNLASNGLALVGIWGFTRGDVLLHALPIYHVHGLFVAIHCVLLSGARMLWLPKFDPREVVALLPRATVMMGVPTFYTRLLAEPTFTRDIAARVRLFVSGSAPLLAETFAAFEAHTGMAVLERYGMTETGMNTSNPLDGARVGGTVGKALPGVEVRVVDESGTACAGPTSLPVTGGCRKRRARSSPPMDTSGPATWANWWLTARHAATCAWSAAPRISSSRAASTSIRSRSRSVSTAWTASSKPP
jgi:malonyl-CoA/methylmalonyl-CoA synthetase